MGFRQNKVGRYYMQIEGLDDIFHKYFEEGRAPDEMIGTDMIREIRKQNFVPEDSEDLYYDALLREYKSYYNSRF